MGLHFMDSDGIFFVEDKSVIHDDRGHRKLLKNFSSEAEAEAYLRGLMRNGSLLKRLTGNTKNHTDPSTSNELTDMTAVS